MMDYDDAQYYYEKWKEGHYTKSEIDKLFGHERSHGKWCTKQWFRVLGIDTEKKSPLAVKYDEALARIAELEEKLELCQLYPATA